MSRACQGQAGARGFVDGQIREVKAAAARVTPGVGSEEINRNWYQLSPTSRTLRDETCGMVGLPPTSRVSIATSRT